MICVFYKCYIYIYIYNERCSQEVCALLMGLIRSRHLFSLLINCCFTDDIYQWVWNCFLVLTGRWQKVQARRITVPYARWQISPRLLLDVMVMCGLAEHIIQINVLWLQYAYCICTIVASKLIFIYYFSDCVYAHQIIATLASSLAIAKCQSLAKNLLASKLSLCTQPRSGRGQAAS